MTRCFWRVSGVFSVCFGVGLQGARADRLRFGHLAHSLRRADTRAGPSGARRPELDQPRIPLIPVL